MTHIPSGNHRAELKPVDNLPHDELNRWWITEQAKRPVARYPLRTITRWLLAVGGLFLVAAACWSVYLLTEM